MQSASDTKLSKLLAYVLRHHPEEFDLTLDDAGWTSVDELVIALRSRRPGLTSDDVYRVVHENDKQRFALSPDGHLIRANQGHSIEVDLTLPPQTPPEILYHGTVARFLDAIRSQGLLKGQSQHVHLSANLDVARSVGSRRGKPLVLVVRAGQMSKDGKLFYLSANGVWLTDYVPARYLDFSSV